nr:immunoglobulin heavy chain junction region [Mus musculus]
CARSGGLRDWYFDVW